MANGSESSLQSFAIGTGRTIFASSLLPAILSARYEVILATCFWAPGPTLELLVEALKQLSEQVVSRGQSDRIKVYICFSSRSLLQKLLHTSSMTGHVYKSDTWVRKLGLPPQSEIPGLDLKVKSLFFRPFSVLHSKYLIVDQKNLWMPSCNVSWEEWYECSIHLKGPIVDHVFSFWQETWDTERRVARKLPDRSDQTVGGHLFGTTVAPGLRPLKVVSFKENSTCTVKLLPHGYCISPKLNFWMLQSMPPATPLNTALLNLFNNASRSIVLLTPNLTAAPVYHAIVAALERGVDVRLITNRKMMVLEQLLTSGTITEYWLWRLKRRYKKSFRDRHEMSLLPASDQNPRLGRLTIQHFAPHLRPRSDPQRFEQDVESGKGIASMAVKTHIKLTLVDDHYIVLGSGNMDRASWYTSQELGIMVQDRNIAKQIMHEVEIGFDGCLESYL